MLQNSVRPAGVPLIRDSRKNDFLLKEFRGSPAALGGHGALNFRWSVFSDLIRSQYPVFKVRRAGSCAAQGGMLRPSPALWDENVAVHISSTNVSWRSLVNTSTSTFTPPFNSAQCRGAPRESVSRGAPSLLWKSPQGAFAGFLCEPLRPAHIPCLRAGAHQSLGA